MRRQITAWVSAAAIVAALVILCTAKPPAKPHRPAPIVVWAQWNTPWFSAPVIVSWRRP